jgi:predicted RNA binding protein YcfA (HicA-like mRNA interferase family)
MKAVTGRRMARIAESKGWTLARINGSHHVYTMDGRMERVVMAGLARLLVSSGLFPAIAAFESQRAFST